MTDSTQNENPDQKLAERVRQACLDAATTSYEDAAIAGLCQQGAMEIAMDAIRDLDLTTIVAQTPESGD